MKASQPFIFLIGLLAFFTTGASEPRLDHVVVAVQDLHTARELFQSSGFTLKDGKVHNNGLVNAFIEFADGTEIELMSVFGTSDDPLASTYSQFLAHSEGGIFVALSGFHIEDASKVLRAANVDHDVQRGNLWDYLTFPTGSGLEHVFLIETHQLDTGGQTVIEHKNGVTGLDEVWLESNENLENMLRILNVMPHADDRVYKLSNASLRLVGKKKFEVRPRFKGIVLSFDNGNTIKKIEAHGIWIMSSNDDTDDESS